MTALAPGPSASGVANDRATSASPCACSHCGLPVPEALRVPQSELQFCCHGCRSVHELLHACDLTEYYRLRDAFAEPETAGDTNRPQDDGLKPNAYDSFADPAFQQAHVQTLDNGTQRVDLLVADVHCAACLWLLERLPRVCPGVVEARLSLRRKVVRVTWDPDHAGRPTLPKIARTLHTLGFPPRPDTQDPDAKRAARRRDERKRWIGMAVAGACAGNAMLLAFALYSAELDGGDMDAGFATLFRVLSAVVGVIALLGPGWVFFRSAIAALRTRTANLDLPIALALGAGGVAGLINVALGSNDVYFDSLTVLVFLLLVGRYVQYRQQRWADDAVGLMLTLTPVTCRIVKRLGQPDEHTLDAPIEALQPGDVVEVRPGEPLPGDGVVLEGASDVDQATLTGESLPVRIKKHDRVFAGTTNVSANLRIAVDHVGQDSRVGQLMQRVGDGLDQRPPIVLLTDRIAGYFVTLLSLFASLTFLGWWLLGGSAAQGVSHAVAMLILACPCALALATPLTLAVATGKAAQRDILIKRAAVLQLLAEANCADDATLWFDKTGTLTHGKPALLAWHGPDALQPWVAQLEAESTHPVGQCLSSIATPSEHAKLTDRIERGDGGVSAVIQENGATHRIAVGSAAYFQRYGQANVPNAFRGTLQDAPRQGHNAVLVEIDGHIQALAILGDTLRPEAAAVLHACRDAGWKPALLTGDTPDAARFVAQQAGVPADRVVAGVLPEQKLERLRERRPGHVQALVGDGVNDAAALAAADVGIAVRGGAEAALAAADVFLARDGLTALPELLRLARGTLRTIRFNLRFCLVYNGAAVILAAAGFVTPLVAAVLMPLSSATVLFVAIVGLHLNTKTSSHL